VETYRLIVISPGVGGEKNRLLLMEFEGGNMFKKSAGFHLNRQLFLN
jgi:hypothetical protein